MARLAGPGGSFAGVGVARSGLGLAWMLLLAALLVALVGLALVGRPLRFDDRSDTRPSGPPTLAWTTIEAAGWPAGAVAGADAGLYSNGSSFLLHESPRVGNLTQEIWRSTDFRQWEAIPPPNGQAEVTLRVVGDTYVIGDSGIGECPCRAWTSPDGITWTPVEPGWSSRLDVLNSAWGFDDAERMLAIDPPRNPAHLLYGPNQVILDFGGHFVTVMDPESTSDTDPTRPSDAPVPAWQSVDGRRWIEIGEPAFRDDFVAASTAGQVAFAADCNIAWRPGQAAALFPRDGRYILWLTDDGVTWTEAPLDPPLPVEPRLPSLHPEGPGTRWGPNDVLPCLRVVGDAWAIVPVSQHFGEDPPFAGDLLPVDNEMLISADGRDWHTVALPIGADVERVMYVGGRTLIVGTGPNRDIMVGTVEPG